MSKDDALKMAIIDLEVCSSLMTTCEYSDDFYQAIQNTIDDCKEALEQPAQEPVYFISDPDSNGWISVSKEKYNKEKYDADKWKLYTHPHQDGTSPSKWTALTDDEILEKASQIMVTKHYDKEKNT